MYYVNRNSQNVICDCLNNGNNWDNQKREDGKMLDGIRYYVNQNYVNHYLSKFDICLSFINKCFSCFNKRNFLCSIAF